jgi:hypothetical protein
MNAGMGDPVPSVVFLGDLDDPWVVEIAGALPSDARILPAAEALPDTWPEAVRRAGLLVLHRGALTAADRDRLERLRQTVAPLRVILCPGPHVRYHQLERWGPLIDLIVPEAVASEVIARHASPGWERARTARETNRVTVISGQFDLRSVLGAMVREAGYRVDERSGWSASASDLVVWDVPVLDGGWTETLHRYAPGRRVVAVLGFADRDLVRSARALGAAACLDSTCELEDLHYVLDWLSVSHGSRQRRVRVDLASTPRWAAPRGGIGRLAEAASTGKGIGNADRGGSGLGELRNP